MINGNQNHAIQNPSPTSIAPIRHKTREILKLNPVLHIVDQLRQAILWQEIPDRNILIMLWISSLVVFQLGYWVFQRLRSDFADVLWWVFCLPPALQTFLELFYISCIVWPCSQLALACLESFFIVERIIFEKFRHGTCKICRRWAIYCEAPSFSTNFTNSS